MGERITDKRAEIAFALQRAALSLGLHYKAEEVRALVEHGLIHYPHSVAIYHLVADLAPRK